VFTARYGLAHYVLFSNNTMFSGRAKAEAVSRQPLMTVWLRSRPHDIGGGHSITGKSFLPVIWCRSTNAPYSSSSTCCSYYEDKRAKPGNLPPSNTFSEIRGAPHRRILSLFHAHRGENVEFFNVTNCCMYISHHTFWELRKVAKKLSTPNTQQQRDMSEQTSRYGLSRLDIMLR
jgi:hypothetical protein